MCLNYVFYFFLANILTTILKLLESYRNGIYISQRVLQQSIIFIEQAYALHIN